MVHLRWAVKLISFGCLASAANAKFAGDGSGPFRHIERDTPLAKTSCGKFGAIVLALDFQICRPRLPGSGETDESVHHFGQAAWALTVKDSRLDISLYLAGGRLSRSVLLQTERVVTDSAELFLAGRSCRIVCAGYGENIFSLF